MARVSYYVDLAASICREVGAYNSDTYTKCMLGTALDPMRSLEEKERIVADYHKKVGSNLPANWQHALDVPPI